MHLRLLKLPDADSDYEPVTITLNLERSGLGENVEYTFTKKPSKVVASGDQMADFFFDLGLEDQMAGYTKGSCWSTGIPVSGTRQSPTSFWNRVKVFPICPRKSCCQPDVIF